MRPDQYRSHLRGTLALLGLSMLLTVLAFVSLFGGLIVIAAALFLDPALALGGIWLVGCAYLFDLLAKMLTGFAAERSAFEDGLWDDYMGKLPGDDR